MVIYDFEEIRSKRDRFIEQTKFYTPYLRKYKMTVNFKGYTEIWDDYFIVDNLNLEKLFSLSRELIMWKNYFANLKCMFQFKCHTAENKKSYLEAFINKRRKNKLLDKQIEDVDEEIKFLREYLKLLKKQETNFNNAIKHCLQLYDEGISKYIQTI